MVKKLIKLYAIITISICWGIDVEAKNLNCKPTVDTTSLDLQIVVDKNTINSNDSIAITVCFSNTTDSLLSVPIGNTLQLKYVNVIFGEELIFLDKRNRPDILHVSPRHQEKLIFKYPAKELLHNGMNEFYIMYFSTQESVRYFSFSNRVMVNVLN